MGCDHTTKIVVWEKKLDIKFTKRSEFRDFLISGFLP